ncbi:MAG: hypothetical protein E6Q97_30095 [Desulfurellales bacterium]|nr:MAG: hypothetical protein E6Q97_30095 [Desulfurellales bacterium]
MADACGSSSLFARIAYSNAATGEFAAFSSANPAFPLADGGTSLSWNQAHVNAIGLNGRTAQSTELTRPGLELVDGDIPLLLTPVMLDTFLPHITGRALSAGVTYPAEAEPGKFHILLHRDSSLYTYIDLYIVRAEISGTAGEPLRASFSIVGKTREKAHNAGSNWPVGLETSKSVPYMFSDLNMTVDGDAFPLRSFRLVYDSGLAPVYFDDVVMCGVKRQGMTNTTLQLVLPHTATSYADVLHGATPPSALNIVLTATHPTAGMSFIMRAQGWQAPPKDPNVPGGEILLDLTGTCRTVDSGASGGAEIIFTNDSTPT